MTVLHPELDKTRILELIRAEYRFTERTLALLTPEQMHLPNVEGAWSVKDTVAHLSAWLRRVERWVEDAMQDTPVVMLEPGFGWGDIDRLNQTYYERDKDRPLEDVLGEFQKLTLAVIEDVEALSEADLFTRKFEGVRDPLCNYIVGNTYEHFSEHLVPVRRWMMAHGR